MLTIFVDVQCLQGENLERGIPRWSIGFIRHLRNTDCRLIALQNPRLPNISEDLHWLFSEVTINSRHMLRERTLEGKSVYLVLSPFEPVRPLSSLLPLHIVDAQIPVAVVIHDLTPYLFPNFYQLQPQDERIAALKYQLFSKSTLFLCNSFNTAEDLKNIWQVDAKKICVIGTGISPFFFPVLDFSLLHKKFGVDSPYVFCVGRKDPRKQTHELIYAFSELKKKWFHPLQLVLTCNVSRETKEKWQSLAQSLGLTDCDVIITGAVSDDDLRVLYSCCSLFVEPSLYEGFGFPPAEAAACGAVVITSNTSSLPEVIQDPAATFDPTNRQELVDLMKLALNNKEFRSINRSRSKLSIRKHNWEEVSSRAFQVFSKIARRVEVPQRILGDLAPLNSSQKFDSRTTITPEAVDRFYAVSHFDSIDFGKPA